jgi:hypothetical protein
MSQQDEARSEIARGARVREVPPAIKLTPETRMHRSLDERVIVRSATVRFLLRALWTRLPTHSRLRRVMVARLVEKASAAASRRDFEYAFTGFDEAIEYHAPALFPDPDPVYNGHDGYRDAWRLLVDAFGDAWVEPFEVLDLGDRLLVTARLRGHGSGSGAFATQQVFQLFELRRGLVIRQQDFTDRAKALEAAGLPEQDAHAGS